MQLKNIGITVSIIIGIVIIGIITLEQNSTQDSVEKYAVSSETLNVLLENKERVLVVDIRTAEEYQSGHLAGASHDVMDSVTLEKRAKTIQNRLSDVAAKYNFVLIDNDGTHAKKASQTMSDLGIQTFYLDGGMSNLSEDLVSSSQTVIGSEELMKKLAANEDLFLLDVREPDELLESKIGGAVNIPLAEIFQPDRMDSIPTDKPVVVICGSGNRATIATYALAQEGIDFQVLEGGMKTWNLQIESGM
ncbi:MAG: rhodanese-like domain-containing protein [Nitrosopumilus sp.]|nr:rhodanese-like domain-containing protein [Nitrosopumilus sp.]